MSDIENKDTNRDNNISNTENNSNDDKYEKVCYICRRTESKAGKMIVMPGNMYICPDCMQKTFDSINKSGMNYDDLFKNMPPMGNYGGFMFGDMNDQQIPNKNKIKKKKDVKDKNSSDDVIDLKRYRHRMLLSLCLTNMLSDRNMPKKLCQWLYIIIIRGLHRLLMI